MAIRGRDWYLARVKNLVTQFPKAVGDAMLAEGQNIQRRSQELCPVDKGTMKRSATTTQIGTDDSPRVRIAYGTKYAIYVHERVDLYHENGQAKFLEDALIENRNVYIQNLWRRTSANLKKAGL